MIAYFMPPSTSEVISWEMTAAWSAPMTAEATFLSEV